MLLVFRARASSVTPVVKTHSEWARRRMIVRNRNGWDIVLRPDERRRF